MNTVRVEPHAFEPLRRFMNRGRCAVCMLDERYHGLRFPNWPLARPIGDKSPSIPPDDQGVLTR